LRALAREAALGVHVEQGGGDDLVPGEGGAREHERVDEAAGGSFGEVRAGAEGSGHGGREGKKEERAGEVTCGRRRLRRRRRGCVDGVGGSASSRG
jgi:hypothetical protein